MRAPPAARRLLPLFVVWLIFAAPPVNSTVPPRVGSHSLSIAGPGPGHPTPQFTAEFGSAVRSVRRTVGEGWVAALLVDFPDRPANRAARPGSFYEDLLFSVGTHSTGSLRDFYLEQSYGAWDITGTVTGWLRTAESYYTSFDDGNFGASGGARGACIAGLLLADPTVDFGAFDSDGPDGVPNSGDDDGFVDACIVFIAGVGGHDTYDPSDFWPVIVSFIPEFDTNDPRTGGGNIKIDMCSIQPEVNLDYPSPDTLSSSLSVVAHEYGHLIGLPDLYDNSNTTWGIGYWGLMGYGSFGYERTGPYQMSAWSKVRLGWITPTVVTGNLDDVVLPPVETNPVAYQVPLDGMEGTEYFLIENRQPLLHDTLLPGHGLLIWHVDDSVLGAPTAAATSPEHDHWISLEQADGRNDMNAYFVRPNAKEYYPEMGDGGDPFPGDSLNTTFDGSSNPSSHDRAGEPTDVAMTNISQVGDDIHLDISLQPTPVFFTRVTAAAVGTGVRVAWSVFADEPIDRFVIYRSGIAPRPFMPVGEVGAVERDHLDAHVRAGTEYRYRVSAVRPDGVEVASPPVAVTVPRTTLALRQNVPNPFNPGTTISFVLPEAARVHLAVYSAGGTRVRVLEDGRLPAGVRSVRWDGRNNEGTPAPSGIYFCRLRAGKQRLTRKMVLIR